MRNIQFDEPSRAPRNEQPRWTWWLFGTGFLATILIVASMLSPWVRHEWSLSLFRQDAPYTQLAFTRAEALPVTIVSGTPIPIYFAITNNEGKQMSYQYVVASGSGTKMQSLSSSNVTVAAGETSTVVTHIVPKCETTTCRIQVSLPRQGEEIDFIFKYQKA